VSCRPSAMAEKSQLLSGHEEAPAASEPVEHEHPARSRDFTKAIISNIRMVEFEPQPYPNGFFKRPAVVAFVTMYVITGVGIPFYIMNGHYNDLNASGSNQPILEDNWHKRRVARAYLCMIPMALLALPVFMPSLARASVMPYIAIVAFALREAVDEVVTDDFKNFLIRALSNLLATLCALSYLRFMDYLDHVVHQIMLTEHSLIEEKPIQKMRGILHSVGVTRSGNSAKDKFMAMNSHTDKSGIADVVYEKVWHPIRVGSNMVALGSYITYTLASERAGLILIAGCVYYFGTAVFLGYRFFDQCTVLVKIWMHKPFFVGDLVTINLFGRTAEAGINGFVEHITLSYVVIRTFDTKQTYVPLVDLGEAVLQNWSRRPTKPLLMNFTASPSSDPEKVNELVSFAKRWINESQHVLQSGYKKCCLNGLAHGFEIKIVCSPAIGVKKTELRQAFVLEVAGQAKKLNVALASEDASSVFLPDELISKKSN